MNKIKENLSLITVSVVTITYLLFIFKATELREFIELELNAKGDFLAGVFAPLAFMWLVFGYYQQGRELKLNTEALRLQADELQNSVEQQRLLVKAATEDLDLTKTQFTDNFFKELIKSQPFIHLRVNARKWINNQQILSLQNQNDERFNNLVIDIAFTNSRILARELTLKMLHQNEILMQHENQVFHPDNKMTQKSISLDYPKVFQSDQPYILDLKFSYLDELDQKQYQDFKIKIYRVITDRDQHVEIIRGMTSFKNIQPH